MPEHKISKDETVKNGFSLQTVVCVVIMFGTQWAYALGELVVALVVYVYIGQASPGYFPGRFTFDKYLHLPLNNFTSLSKLKFKLN